MALKARDFATIEALNEGLPLSRAARRRRSSSTHLQERLGRRFERDEAKLNLGDAERRMTTACGGWSMGGAQAHRLSCKVNAGWCPVGRWEHY